MTVDGVWSLIGSANLDTRSLRLNFELNLSVYDAYLTESLNQYVEEILNFSHRVSLQEMDHRPLPIRVRDGIARLFSPYL
jgi:cardiolipin synthase